MRSKIYQRASLFLLSFRLVYKLLSPFFELCVKSVKQFTVYFLSTKKHRHHAKIFLRNSGVFYIYNFF